MEKKKDEHKAIEPAELDSIPTISEGSSSLGDIKINHTVVASIVKLATIEVPGVVSIAEGGLVGEIAGIFSKKEAGAGIQVGEDEDAHYVIVIRVILSFGIELAKTAYEIQTSVKEQVEKMTNKHVARVDVIIDGVKMPEPHKEESEQEAWQESPVE